MWEFDINGDLYFEKAINGFLTDLFAKWKVCYFFHIHLLLASINQPILNLIRLQKEHIYLNRKGEKYIKNKNTVHV